VLSIYELALIAAPLTARCASLNSPSYPPGAPSKYIDFVAGAYFPVFSLAAAAGSDSVSASSWLGAPSRFWSIGPQGLLTVFDGGLHRAQSAAARAAYEEQVANYRSGVLTAFQEVEDNLAALRQLERESVSEAAAVASTQGTLDQANARYQSGLGPQRDGFTAPRGAREIRRIAQHPCDRLPTRLPLLRIRSIRR
jgi:outer membrane protein TolC